MACNNTQDDYGFAAYLILSIISINFSSYLMRLARLATAMQLQDGADASLAKSVRVGTSGQHLHYEGN